ncbi:fungal pheromone STE3G-protein-coupled receptor, partial [Cadophora sp. DSE1049]
MPDEVANPGNAIALPLFAALALLITYLPLRSFYRVKNIAACSMMAVIIIINLMALINGILWPSDDWTKWWMGYGLCDIEVILRFPITMALATSLCCLTKGLADALDTEHAVFNPSKAQRRRKVIGDVMFCWFVPVMMMALHYIVQAGRYMIIPVWGCADQLDNSWPMLVIIIMWCPMFTLLNVYYGALMFFRLYRHRKTISAALTSTGSGLAPRKFIKLVLISVLLIVIYLPIQTLFVFYAIPSKFVPYSWSRVHNPATWPLILFLHTGMQPSLQWAGWAGVASSAFMFAFFGFNDDAVDTYRAALVKCGAGKIWPSLKLSR